MRLCRVVRGAPPPEVRKIRLVHFPAICVAPGYLAEELLYAEGFEQVEYVEVDINTSSPRIAAGEADIVERLGWPAVKAEIVLRALEARGVVIPSTAGEPATAAPGR